MHTTLDFINAAKHVVPAEPQMVQSTPFLPLAFQPKHTERWLFSARRRFNAC